MGIDALTPQPGTKGNNESLVEFADNRLLIDLCGAHDRNLARIEQLLDVQIVRRGNRLLLLGAPEARAEAEALLGALYRRLEAGKALEAGDIEGEMRLAIPGAPATTSGTPTAPADTGRIEIRTRKKTVEPRSPAQAAYLAELLRRELVFGIGPAGTGKTYLAVAVAVHMFITGKVDRIILSRPAVEAGERLGFLPGDMKEKVDPYMQPLYDALNDFLPGKQLARLIEEKQIEIAPLAFMRGRTLTNAFVVLDEAQNASAMQMKMFLTRLGEGSRMVITGDRSQVDLPRGAVSGLHDAEGLLRHIPEIGFTYFTSKDVVRHALVARIIDAYDKADPLG